MDKWKQRARALKQETYALYLACRDPETPWYAKVFVAFVVGYAFSPVDLIPDFIPILGYLDDIIIVPLGIAMAVKMVPAHVLDKCRGKASDELTRKNPRFWLSAVIIIAVWLVAIAVVMAVIANIFFD